MATAKDAAAYIVEQLGRCDTMKLQKILYYSQGWHLAWDGVPLFDDRIEAWANGPVTPTVFAEHRGQFMVESWESGNSSVLTPDEVETIDAVLSHYGKFTGARLSEMTHEERPWREARGGTPPGARSNTEIDMDVMQEFFGGLATP